MKIRSIETFRVKVPLKKPFKTALRQVKTAQTIIVKITDEEGKAGYGEAPPTHVITGETLDSIEAVIHNVITPAIFKESILEREQLFGKLHQCVVGNTSAKAAIDMAIHDLLGQTLAVPLYQLLGGARSSFETCHTVSVNDPDEMAKDSMELIRGGFTKLKVKVGTDSVEKDIERVRQIRLHVGRMCSIRLDANQGWTAKEAVYAIRKMEDEGLNLELVEQPVKADDVIGLKQVTDHTDTPIMADESIFSVSDARRVLESRAVDLVNIKLMKAGGIHNALTINKLAESYGVACMVGSMIETGVGATAAAHFAASQRNITYFDLDAPLLLSHSIVEGGLAYDKGIITLPDSSGLGIQDVAIRQEPLTFSSGKEDVG